MYRKLLPSSQVLLAEALLVVPKLMGGRLHARDAKLASELVSRYES